MSTPSPPTQRVVSVLALLADSPSEALGASEVARRLGLHKSTCHNILATLAEAGLLSRSDADKTYTLGPALVRLGEAARIGAPVLRVAQPVLERLSKAIGFATWLSGFDGERLQTLATAEFGAGEPIRPRIGRSVPFGSPFGAMVAAFSGEATQEVWLARGGVPGEDVARLRRMLARLRRAGVGVWRLAPSLELMTNRMRLGASFRGHAEDDAFDPVLALYFSDMADRPYTTHELSRSGSAPVGSVLAPVFDATAVARYEMGIAVFRERISLREIRRTVVALEEAASSLSREIGAEPARLRAAR